VRGYVQERLPGYMQPGRLVVVERLPRTSSGKIDRQALGQVGERQEGGEERGGREGKTDLEEVLGQIWAEVLEVEEVEREANFFELGGHSLLVTQLLAQVQKVMQVELPVTALFEAPTLGELAEEIRKAQRQGVEEAPE